MLRITQMKMFENVTVCMQCMRVYKFTQDLYSRIEENMEHAFKTLQSSEPPPDK
jgi:hypothetical protein